VILVGVAPSVMVAPVGMFAQVVPGVLPRTLVLFPTPVLVETVAVAGREVWVGTG